jgi:hypothetical protein
MNLSVCNCPSQAATSMHAKRHRKAFFFSSSLEGFRTSDYRRQLSAITALSDFRRGPVLASSFFQHMICPLQSLPGLNP